MTVGAVAAGTSIPRRCCFLLTDRPAPAGPLVVRRRAYLLVLLVKFMVAAVSVGGGVLWSIDNVLFSDRCGGPKVVVVFLIFFFFFFNFFVEILLLLNTTTIPFFFFFFFPSL